MYADSRNEALGMAARLLEGKPVAEAVLGK